MATAAPLMPKATAVWLVDNTALTFDQVADFSKLHPLEVKAIADGDAAQGIKGIDPISDRPADPRARSTEARRTRTTGSSSATSKVAVPPADARRRARAIRRCRAATSGRTRSCGWCATIPS